MSIRVLVTLLISAIGIAGTFINAFIGLLTYAFWSYLHPEKITWGLLPVTRVSYIVGLCLVVSTFIQKKALFARNWKNILIILFWILCWISLFLTPENEYARSQFQYFFRIILITLIMPVLIDDKEKLRYYLWAITIFIGLVAAQSGFIGTLKGEVGGAAAGLRGPIADRNFYAVMLCIVIPIVFYLGNIERDKRLKILLRFIFIGCILALILTYARAGFLGLIAVCFFMYLRTRRKLLWGIIGFFMLVIFVTYFLPTEYKERIYTMRQYDIAQEDVDMSAAGRLIAWRSAIEMIKKHPITGVGFYNSEPEIENYPDPVTGIKLENRAIHNTILQIAAEIGLPAFLIYFIIFSASYKNLGNIKNKVKNAKLDAIYDDYSSMLQVAFVGFFVTGFFVNAAFIDISWHLVGLTIALEQIVRKEIRRDVA